MKYDEMQKRSFYIDWQWIKCAMNHFSIKWISTVPAQPELHHNCLWCQTFPNFSQSEWKEINFMTFIQENETTFCDIVKITCCLFSLSKFAWMRLKSASDWRTSVSCLVKRLQSTKTGTRCVNNWYSPCVKYTWAQSYEAHDNENGYANNDNDSD